MGIADIPVAIASASIRYVLFITLLPTDLLKLALVELLTLQGSQVRMGVP